MRFRIGAKQYDTRAENNTRWINLSVKAFAHICERIRKMDLKEGSYINLVGRLDEDSWTDQKTGETRSAMVVILDDVEFASGGGKSKGAEQQQSAQQIATPLHLLLQHPRRHPPILPAMNPSAANPCLI